MPNGIFSADHRLIGVPCFPFDNDDNRRKANETQVLIVNAKSNYIDAAIRYVEYNVKGMEVGITYPDDETWAKTCLQWSTELWEK